MQRFTEQTIAAFRLSTDRYEIWEDGELGIRISPGGKKSWIWAYHFEGRPRRVALGTYPEISLARARIKLARAKKILANGVDPRTVKIERCQADYAAKNCSQLIDSYIAIWARPNKRSAPEDERILEKDVRPAWGKRKAKDITRRDVVALLDQIALDRRAPIQANRTLAVIRKMFNWAVSRDLTPFNPCTAVKAPARETRRDRVLTRDEISKLWAGLGCPQLAMTNPIRLALKFLLATAQRKGEVIGAEWSEFDIEIDKIWTIPATRSKNRMAHRVPLSPFAIELLSEIKREGLKPRGRAGSRTESELSRYLFRSPRGDKPIIHTAVDHAMHKNLGEFGLIGATPHDLRRTAASYMTSIGVSRLVVSKILNHTEFGVTAIYDRYAYDVEKRTALEAWAHALRAMIEGNTLDAAIAAIGPQPPGREDALVGHRQLLPSQMPIWRSFGG